MDSKIVTCIVLSYNNFECIFDTIDSILNQDFPLIEIIIADDCSKEIDINIIEQYIATKKKLNIINSIVLKNKTNLGTVKNFNNAIKISMGDYIFPIATDDVFYNNKIFSKLVSEFCKSSNYILTCNSKFLSNDKKNNKSVQSKNAIKTLKSNDINKKLKNLALGNYISGSVTYFKKEVFTQYGLFDEKYKLIEDWSHNLQILRKGIDIKYFDLIAIRYRVGGISTKKKKSKQFLLDYIKIIENEILPYKNIFGFFAIRYNLWQVKKIRLDLKGKYKTIKLLFLSLIYIDITIYKAIRKIKEFF